MAKGQEDQTTFELFERSFGRSELKPVYVLHGDEPLLIDSALALIEARVLEGSARDVALSELDGAAVEPSAVLDELRTLPFLSKKRLVVVRNADAFTTKHGELLSKYLDDPSRTGVLVLVASKWSGRSALAKKVRKCGTVVSCGRPRQDRMPGWIAARARKLGKQIAGDAALALAESAGADLLQVAGHIKKLAVYVGDRKRIEKADVEAVVGTDRERATWELGEAIRTRRPSHAVKIIRQIIDRSEDAKYWILGSMANEIRKIWTGKRLMKMRVDDAAMSAAVRVHRYFLSKFKQEIRSFTEDELRRKHEMLLAADVEMKTSAADAALILEKLAIALCRK